MAHLRIRLVDLDKLHAHSVIPSSVKEQERALSAGRDGLKGRRVGRAREVDVWRWNIDVLARIKTADARALATAEEPVVVLQRGAGSTR